MDLSPREIAILGPLVLLTLYYGVHPAPILNASMASVEGILKTVSATVPGAKTAALSPSQD